MDPVRQLLKERGCADFIVEGGIQRLVRDWEATTRSVAAGEEQEYYSYLNDMDGREILHWAMPVASEDERHEYEHRIARADALMRSHVRHVNSCVWGAAVAAERHLMPNVNWWYFTVPPVRDDHEVWDELMRA